MVASAPLENSTGRQTPGGLGSTLGNIVHLARRYPNAFAFEVFCHFITLKFLAEAGDDFESKARRLIRDDYAAIKEIKTATELSEALGTIAAAVLQEEIKSAEANGALAFLGQLLRTARNSHR